MVFAITRFSKYQEILSITNYSTRYEVKPTNVLQHDSLGLFPLELEISNNNIANAASDNVYHCKDFEAYIVGSEYGKLAPDYNESMSCTESVPNDLAFIRLFFNLTTDSQKKITMTVPTHAVIKFRNSS